MTNNIIQGDFVTFKHIKTRKSIVLEVEVPEEQFKYVFDILGMPLGGESKPVAIALLDKEVLKSNDNIVKPRASQRAALLCKDVVFQKYCFHQTQELPSEQNARAYIIDRCNIGSRKALDYHDEARHMFNNICHEYHAWKHNNHYREPIQ